MKTKRSVKENSRLRFSLMIIFSLIMLAVFLVTVAVTSLEIYILDKCGVMVNIGVAGDEIKTLLVFIFLNSLIIGCGVSLGFSHFPMKPVNTMIDQTNRLASGDYTVRLEFDKITASHPAFEQMSESFNTLATELENTEMLRSDFINNISHEFKTPIVSIRGFAKLLRRPDLSETEREEYIGIIEEEARRLSYMAQNVLDLTRVENQTILTDTVEYNMSEQLRSCILLLEQLWSEKEPAWELELGEYTVVANEELMRQVWINLLHNAIKFTPAGEKIALIVHQNAWETTVQVINRGETIPLEKQEHIFRKFYQADESHSAEGNGVGLAIVKRIVGLHGGSVTVRSEAGETAFTVRLPRR